MKNFYSWYSNPGLIKEIKTLKIGTECEVFLMRTLESENVIKVHKEFKSFARENEIIKSLRAKHDSSNWVVEVKEELIFYD